MPFKFLHAADLHLDSPLRGLEAYDGAPADEIRGASHRALENLVALALAERVAFVLLAGDIYDGDWRDVRTGLFFVSQAARLREAGIPVFSIRGNHDAESRMTGRLKLPDNVVELSCDEPETRELPDLGVAIHGQGFRDRAERSDLARRYPQARPGLFNVGLLHTCLSGAAADHAPYAPTSLDVLLSKGYDYWALGHVHTRAVVRDDPPVVFPGNIQGRHIREPGAKGCMIVSVDDRRRATPEFRELDVLRWEVVRADVSDAPDLAAAEDAVEAALLDALRAADDRLLAARVEVVGATRAHGEIARDPDHFAHRVRALAAGNLSGRVWVEKVLPRTSPPRAWGGPALADAQGPVGELRALAAELADDPRALAALLPDDVAKLVERVADAAGEPRDAVFPSDDDAMRDRLALVEAALVERLLSE